MNTLDNDSQRHYVPLVLVLGLTVPKHGDAWRSDCFFSTTGHSLIASNDLFVSGDVLTTSGLEDQVQFPELFHLLSAKSCKSTIWKPPTEKHKAVLNFSFLDSSCCGDDGGDGSNISLYRLPQVKSLNQRSPSFEYTRNDQHSPIAPSTSFSVTWIKKYLHLLPATFLVFAQLGTDDEILIQRLQALKMQLEKRQIHMIVVLVYNPATIIQAKSNLTDRHSYFRKFLDLKKSSMYLLGTDTTGFELRVFCEKLCHACYTIAQDFYADAAKRVRNRSSGHLKHESNPAVAMLWRIQNQYKQAVFQEFRQNALESVKLYETTYELASDYLASLSLPTSNIEVIQWNDLRKFLDALAFKIINLALLTRTPSIAYLKFQVHLKNIGEIIQATNCSSDINLWDVSMKFMLAGLLDETENFYIDNMSSFGRECDEELPNECLPRPGSLYLSGAVHLFEGLANKSDNDTLSDNLYPDNFTKSILIKDLKTALNRASNDFSLGANERCVGYALFLLGESYFWHDRDYIAALAYYNASMQRSRLYKESWPEIKLMLLKRIKEAADLTGDYKDCIFADLNLSSFSDTQELDIRLDKWSACFKNNILDFTKPERALTIIDAKFCFDKDVSLLGDSISFQVFLRSHLNHNKHLWLQSVAVILSGVWTGTIIISHDERLPKSDAGIVRLNLGKIIQSGDNKTIELFSNLAFFKSLLIIEVFFQPTWTGLITVSTLFFLDL